MKAQISVADVDFIKAELGRMLPDVKSSHRVEAMARGLGWNTNAALRADLAGGTALRTVDDWAFSGYLKEHGFGDARYDALTEAVVRTKFTVERAAIEAVMTKEPNLTHFGFGVFDSHKKTPEVRKSELAEGRQSMLTAHAVDEFMRACEYLARRGKRATISKSGTSYGLKHAAERYHRNKDGNGDNYIANGMLIAAAVHLGFKVRPVGPNAYLNIAAERTSAPRGAGSSCAPKRLASFSGGKTRVAAWRNIMVAAINAGLDQGLFGLDSDDNRWPGDHAIYRFGFAGMPAIASVNDIGFGELAIHVAVQPTERAEEFITSDNAGLYAGDAFASGWLERKSGKWLQGSEKPCNAFRRNIMPIIADMTVSPRGYRTSGPVM